MIHFGNRFRIAPNFNADPVPLDDDRLTSRNAELRHDLQKRMRRFNVDVIFG